VKRTLHELLHIVAGVIGTILFAALAAWAVPVARFDIWLVACIAMAAVAFMGVRPLRLAWRADQEAKHGQPGANG
jgi:hypothetical protein